MKKPQFHYIVLLICTCFPICSLFAQAKISGKVVSPQNSPVELATILLKTTDSTYLQSTLTNENGFFELEEKPGNYILFVNYLGQNLYEKNLNLTADLDLGVIQVEDLQVLNEVVVSGEKNLIERKADRIIFNVDQSMYAQGSDAFTTIKNAPRVYVENSQIGVYGKGEAVVLVNDKLVRMSGEELQSFLKNIPSNDIQKIEVITNPSAKYDAQGAALINIVLKKNNLQGINGNINLSYKKAKYSTGNTGIAFNAGWKKMSLKSSIGGGLYNFYVENDNNIQYSNEDWKTQGSYKKKSLSFHQNISWDYDINDQHSVGIAFFGLQNSSLRYTQYNRTDITHAETTPSSYILNLSDNNETRNVYALSAYYTLKIDTTGKQLDFLLDFLDNQPYNKRTYSNTHHDAENQSMPPFNPEESSVGKNHSNNYTAKIDMTHPMEYGEWDYGVKMNLFEINSSNIQAVLQGEKFKTDSSRSDVFNYKEWTAAAYMSFSKTIKKIELITGVRLEYTYLTGRLENTQETNIQKYLRPFPNFLLQYNFKEDQNFNIGINSSIDRPFFNYLNPFRLYTNEYSYSTGNPFLQPAYSQELSLEYNYKNIYNIGLYYYYEYNNSDKVMIVDDATKENYQIWQNGFNSHNVGLYQSIYYTFKKHWTINANTYAGIYSIESPYLYMADRRLGWTFTFNIQNEFVLDKKNRFFASLAYKFYAPGRGYKENRKDMYNGIDAGIRMSLLKDEKLSLSVSATNLLRSTYSGYGISPTGERTSYSNYYDDRQISISVLYKFGKKKLNLKYKNIDNEDADRAK